MKNIFRVFIFCLAIGILFSACGQSTLPSTSTTAPSSPLPTVTPVDLDAIRTSAAGTASVELTKIAGRTSTPTTTPTVTIALTSTRTATRAPTLSPRPFPTLLPTLELTGVPGKLRTALSVTTLNTFNRHNLRRVTGWSNGFDGFQWMGSDHLLLYPIVGQEMMEMSGKVAASYPAVINLTSKKIWLPPSQTPIRKMGTYGGPILPRWSEQLGVLLASESDTSTGTYSPDGDLIKAYEGSLIGVSPSATKILVSKIFVNSTWIDLRNGKKVVFPGENDQQQMVGSYMRPIWSPDEMRIYAGYHIYMDAKTSEIFEMPGTTVDGKKTDFLFDHFYGTWVLDGTYMLPQWHGLWDGTTGFLALFDPATKTYRNVSALAGIPYEVSEVFQSYPCSNYSPSTTTGGRYVWLDCADGGRLIDLVTFKSQTYPDYLEAHLDWSADGNFAWMTVKGDNLPKILSAASKESRPMPVNPSYSIWHPTKNILAYLSENGRTLSLLDAQTMSVKEETTLPIKVQNLIWSPSAERLALVADNNSVWQIDYPNLDHLEQLTPAMPELTPSRPWGIEYLMKNVDWSPDGTSLAFIGDKDIYVVDTKTNP